ncbi:LysE family translocator [Aquitalea palustris]|uniref:LysE family translocator n=1 Tax=Aquitalea palustris TaxID=2480983 RepID=A0A454JMF2_9NEIS|nr:LysE family translocator [Aquitalea palustris]RMD01189.1 LysE family translocator [Aquitalea palustris]
MSPEMLGLYLLAIAVVIAVPGPLSLFMVGNALQFGVWKSWPGFVGGVLASVSLLLLSALGIGSLLLASPRSFLLLQVIGACYLFYLGIRTWQGRGVAASAADSRQGRAQLFSKAFLLGISNPKDIAFFLALLPQFMTPSRPLLPQLLWMVLGWMVIDLLCKLAYGLLASRLLASMAALRRLFLMASALCFVVMGGVLLGQTLASLVL